MRGWALRVIVTRPAGQADELVQRLEEAGHDVVRCPLVQIEPLGRCPIDLSGYDWLVVTSTNGAHELARRARGRPHRIAAIGRATASALAEHDLGPDLVPAVSTQEGLLAELPRPAGRVLVAAAEGARRVLVDGLDADFVPLYRTIELQPPVAPEGDLVVLASGSAARAFARLGVTVPAVSIGPLTTAAAREAGLTVVAEAVTQDLGGILAAVEKARLGR